MYLQPGIPIVISANEPQSVQRAVRDLQSDLKKVLGSESPILDSLEAAGSKPAIVIVGTGSSINIGGDRKVSGTEAHRLFVDGSDHLVLQGADMRGTIYGIYTVSEKFLGVPPMWIWSSWTPKMQQSIEIPAHTDLHYDSPSVKYRAWYPNDMSRLSAWRQENKENDEAWAQTMLRLKLNTIVLDNILAGSSVLSPSASIAKSYGLIAASTHISPFGQNLTSNWNDYWKNVLGEQAPSLALAYTDKLFDMWARNIDSIKDSGLEVVWTIAFRGDGDRPFYNTFVDATSPNAG